MKYKLLSVKRKLTDERNIGDYIQALASAQFLPRIDGFVNREELKSYKEEECAIIMNGWYMHDVAQWPPSEKIHPLFVAFHLNITVADKMLSPEGIKYLKRYQPIGCRDQYTTDVLKSKGIDAYFSGCMTLTLGYKYKNEVKDNTCYVVDPIIPSSHSFDLILKDIVFFFSNKKDVNIVAKKMGLLGSFKERLKASRYLRTYSKYFDKNDLVNAVYISQQNEGFGSGMKDDMHRLQTAEDLVRRYAKARLVITKRIHCALPCLGLETPVYFLKKETTDDVSSCRFEGLTELLNVMEVTSSSLNPDFEIRSKISITNPVCNKDTWKKYANSLIKTCNNFIDNGMV